MYVMKRGGAVWLCTSIEAFESEAVHLRIQNEVRDFEVFKQRLDSYECVEAGVIAIHKCSGAESCAKCDKCKDCEWRKIASETAKAHAEWAKWVYENGGYLL